MSPSLLLAPLALLPLALAAAPPAVAAADADESCPGPKSNVRIFVNVDGVRSSKGNIAVSLYRDDRSKFLAKRGAIFVARAPAKAGRTRLCMSLPGPGTWAFAAYHDADADGSFDRKSIGLPAEAYGFSNNPSTMFGLPNFTSVRLSVPRTNMQTVVKLKYP
jgi:uncharacterized protein (DUF2141 family)